MLLCPMQRERLLHFLPGGGEVAEIGVAEGDFSRAILDVVVPDALHLVDPWVHQAREDYVADPNNVSDGTQASRYESVLARFQAERERGQVHVHRTYSHEAADLFEESRFHWIYVDAMHTAEAVYRDLVAWHDTVKSEGFIIGHDYTNHVQARSWNFGVVDAVNRFVAHFGCEFLALTLEAFPTYVLAKTPGSRTAEALKERLITQVPYIVEIRDFPKAHDFEHKSLAAGDRTLVYPSF